MPRYAVELRNAMLDTYESHIGVSAKCQIRTGAAPTNLTDAAAGTLLAEILCPSDWMNNAGTGSKTLLGSWSVAGVAVGIAGHYRMLTNGNVVKEDGSITATGGGGDMTLNNTSIAVGQTVTITSFTKSL